MLIDLVFQADAVLIISVMFHFYTSLVTEYSRTMQCHDRA